MEANLIDEVKYRVETTLKFFGKKMSADEIRFWVEALEDVATDANQVAKAFADYRKQGKFAPRPRDIIDLMQGNNKAYSPHPKIEEEEEPKADPKIAKAWLLYMREAHDLGITDHNPDVHLERDEWILIVNHEAGKHLERFKFQLDDRVRSNGITRQQAGDLYEQEKHGVLMENYWLAECNTS